MKTSSISSWLLAGLLAVSFAFQTPVKPGAGVMAQNTEEAATPFQQALLASLAEREAAGLPVPQVELSRPVQQGLLMAVEGGQTITATTVIRYDNPQQAGYDSWPAFTLPTGENGAEEDYSQELYDGIAAAIPGFWEHYQVGYEPRIYTIEETTTRSEMEAQELTQIEQYDPQDILFGFTLEDHVPYNIHTSLEVCYEGVCALAAEGGVDFELNWAAGLRLPLSVAIEAPPSLEPGDSIQPAVSLSGQDWDAGQYASHGVSPQGGNEFVLNYDYHLHAYVNIFNIIRFDEDLSDQFDRSRSFATPLGDTIDLPDIDLPPDVTGLYVPIVVGNLGIGLVIHTQMIVQSVYARWQALAGGQVLASGDLTFYQSDHFYSFMQWIDTCRPNLGRNLTLRLDNFKYNLGGFNFDLGLYMMFWIGGYSVRSGEYPVYHYTLPASGELGIHSGTANAVEISIPVIETQAPTSEIQLSGSMGNNGWYRSNVNAVITASDGDCASGVDRIEYRFYDWPWQATSSSTLNLILTMDGRTDITYRAVDRVGNVEESHLAQVYIDKTPPTLSGVPVPAANAYGWNNTKVLIWFSCSDFQSGIAYMTPDTWLGKQGAGQSVTGVCIDNAGNRNPLTVSNVNIDKTPPTVTIVSPQTAIITHDQAVVLAWQAADDLSGLLDQTATLDGSAVTNGQSIDLLTLSLGAHTLTVQAGDRAGNRTSQYRTFKIISTFDSLRAIVARLRSEGHIHSQDTADRIVAQLNLAEAALKSGDTAGAINLLNGLMDRINDQLGNQIDETAYWILRGDIKGLLKNQG